MIARVAGSVPGTVRVCFITEPLAGEGTVSVVGDFNDWDHTRHHMEPGADGRWRVSVDLPAGCRYAFRYLTGNGHWHDDPDADDWCDDGTGQVNSILDLTRPYGGHQPSPPQPPVAAQGTTTPPSTQVDQTAEPSAVRPRHRPRAADPERGADPTPRQPVRKPGTRPT